MAMQISKIYWKCSQEGQIRII